MDVWPSFLHIYMQEWLLCRDFPCLLFCFLNYHLWVLIPVVSWSDLRPWCSCCEPPLPAQWLANCPEAFICYHMLFTPIKANLKAPIHISAILFAWSYHGIGLTIQSNDLTKFSKLTDWLIMGVLLVAIYFLRHKQMKTIENLISLCVCLFVSVSLTHIYTHTT